MHRQSDWIENAVDALEWKVRGSSAQVGNGSGERVSDFATAIGKREQHHATVGGQPASIKRGCDFLAQNGWQTEGELAISVMAGVAVRLDRAGWFRHPFPT